jgi:hypothetical protein
MYILVTLDGKLEKKTINGAGIIDETTRCHRPYVRKGSR